MSFVPCAIHLTFTCHPSSSRYLPSGNLNKRVLSSPETVNNCGTVPGTLGTTSSDGGHSTNNNGRHITSAPPSTPVHQTWKAIAHMLSYTCLAKVP
ncbi:hypothetical protein CONLIGDRAFT_636298 [Coniochaeta ligniaria NRRL 30616]|uniref:Uncharacterized protein n=1 Tax=Coniochaeta ligniaria NRRL 30616 TaxID=1408157 RepID=A0A1J7ID55_9PEZI|nr:hypothetical protein CONLIGDRAFT_636298 [Coniochaeta ligniaria NRRL 30616]